MSDIPYGSISVVYGILFRAGRLALRAYLALRALPIGYCVDRLAMLASGLFCVWVSGIWNSLLVCSFVPGLSHFD